MDKSREIEYPVLDVINRRKSIRAFADKPVDLETLHILFEAARWSFSSGNQQAWRFVYATKDQETLWSLLHGCLDDGNKTWCNNAPVLMVSLAKKTTSRGTPYKHNFHDVGAATMLLALQATALGLQIHPMAGFSTEKIIAGLNTPADLEPVTMIAAGYGGGNTAHLKESHQQAEQERSERFLQSGFAFNHVFTDPV